MRFAIMSDIHGNLPALEAVLADMPPVEGIIVAGDFIGGPQPVETIRLLRSLNAQMIRGNSDTNLVEYDAGRGQVTRPTLHLAFADVAVADAVAPDANPPAGRSDADGVRPHNRQRVGRDCATMGIAEIDPRAVMGDDIGA